MGPVLGQPVEGATLEFLVTGNAGVVDPSRAVTDSVGLATVQFTPAEGWNRLAVRVDATAQTLDISLQAVPPRQVSFQRDSVVLAAPGCSAELFARVLDSKGQTIIGEGVSFSVTDAQVVSLFPIMTTGSFRSMLTGIRGEKPGKTRVIAAHRSGTADSATIEVRAGTAGTC